MLQTSAASYADKNERYRPLRINDADPKPLANAARGSSEFSWTNGISCSQRHKSLRAIRGWYALPVDLVQLLRSNVNMISHSRESKTDREKNRDGSSLALYVIGQWIAFRLATQTVVACLI